MPSGREHGRSRAVQGAYPGNGGDVLLTLYPLREEPSYSIPAMPDEQRVHSSIRISVGRANEEEQIDEAAQRIADAAEQLRAFAL